MSRKPTANQHPQCCRSLKLIYRQNLDLISIFLNYSFLIHRNNSQIRAFEFPRIILGMTCKVRTGKQSIPFLFLVIDNCSHFSSDELIKPRQRYKKYSIYHSYLMKHSKICKQFNGFFVIPLLFIEKITIQSYYQRTSELFFCVISPS